MRKLHISWGSATPRPKRSGAERPPKNIWDFLHERRVRLITATGKFDRGLSQLLHDDLHWLDVPQRVQYKLAVMVHRCLGRRSPSYLADYCVPVSTGDLFSQLFLVASICDPPVAVNSSFHASVAALSALVLSPLRAQQFGILCLTVCVIQLLGLISFVVT